MAVNPIFQRLALLAGPETLDALDDAQVVVVGIGGVGSWCAEALVRSGIGRVVIVDSDTVCITNINRQAQATTATVGEFKTEALRKRLLEINPRCEVIPYGRVFSRESAEGFGIEKADYTIDAIDSLTNKLDLIEYCDRARVPLFSSMGMAQKLDPTRLKTAGIWETRGCPLARLVRAGLRKRNFTGSFTVVYSDERLPLAAGAGAACGTARCLCPPGARESCAPQGAGEKGQAVEWCSSKKIINGSAVTVTAAAGMILASLVLRDIYSRCQGAGDNGGTVNAKTVPAAALPRGGVSAHG
ncbi:MAG: tRNA threonylcarbamoyladenosine dehydratase [Spirochaetaceae bacterium]|jgi:tRNA A37 threonylcarbamoyladenosine dehydratase|nr:tRNA threonylcarbamoyladenosine dehydratase [Spirochaetaceae bacterium]